MKKYSLLGLIRYFLFIGTFGFGGSIALAHTMQRDLVEKKAWLTQEEFTRGFTLCQLAPGPLAAQLAMYIGYVKNKRLGATLAGIAFILPSFLMVLGISILYIHFGSIPFLQSALRGIGAAIIGIIASSGYSLTKINMKKGYVRWGIYFLTLVATLFFKSTNLFFFLIAGCITLLFYNKEKIMLKKMHSIAPIGVVGLTTIVYAKIAIFFLIAGSIAFGGGLAILPYLQSGVVNTYHWLTNKQFIDAVAVAMITPGPVVIASTFIGYIAGGLVGSLIATIAIFLPVYLIVIFLTPLFQRHAQNSHVIAFVDGVLAAAMASIAASVFLLGTQTIRGIDSLLLAIGAFVVVRFFKIPTAIIVLIAGAIGIFLYH